MDNNNNNNMVFSDVNMEKTNPFNSIKAMIDARLRLTVLPSDLLILLKCPVSVSVIKPAECPSELLTNYCRQQLKEKSFDKKNF